MDRKNMKNKVYIIVASMRRNRIGPQIAAWVMDHMPPCRAYDTELVDLNDWHLPLSDEPAIPATGVYVNEHTKAWSQKIARANGYVFVTPQYNWGYPASLKNALDHLFKEWNGKPAAIVSYGFHGGGKAAAQLRQVLEGGLDMRPATAMPAITLVREMFTAEGLLRDPATDFSPFTSSIEQAAKELTSLLVTEQ
jgi:NAD(P)H-dependent FMN reductase